MRMLSGYRGFKAEGSLKVVDCFGGLECFEMWRKRSLGRHRDLTGHLSSVFLVVEPGKIMFLTENTKPQKEDIILLYSGYHSIPK